MIEFICSFFAIGLAIAAMSIGRLLGGKGISACAQKPCRDLFAGRCYGCPLERGLDDDEIAEGRAVHD